MATPDDLRRLDLRIQRLQRARPWLFEALCVTIGAFLFLASWLLGLLISGR